MEDPEVKQSCTAITVSHTAHPPALECILRKDQVLFSKNIPT